MLSQMLGTHEYVLKHYHYASLNKRSHQKTAFCPLLLNLHTHIWGTYIFSCINTVQYRAERYFLNINKHTAHAAVSGYIGWTPMECRMWKLVGNFCCRLTCMTNERMNKKVMVWNCVKGNRACRNWPYRVKI
jgi:hypothetical protein